MYTPVNKTAGPSAEPLPGYCTVRCGDTLRILAAAYCDVGGKRNSIYRHSPKNALYFRAAAIGI